MITAQDWEEFLETAKFITTMNDVLSIGNCLDFKVDVSELPLTFIEALEDTPDDTIKTLKQAVTKMFPKKTNITVILRNFIMPLKPMKVKINQIRSRSIGKMLFFDGIVRTSTDVLPRIEVACFQHDSCMTNLFVTQKGDTLEYPDTCNRCSNPVTQNNVNFREEMSIKEDYQILNVEEEPEGMKGRQPERMECQLHGPFTKEGVRVGAGERVSIVGIYRIRQKGDKTVFEKYLEVIGIEAKGKNYEDFDISKEDEEKFLEMAKNPELMRDLSMVIAPNIEGLDIEKDAILLQQFGGNLFSKEKKRGDLHIGLIGDPSTGKSQIARSIVDIAPHCMRASGAPTTGAGLTAACVQNPLGGFILEAGAAVLADRGILVIDEFDKMNDNVRGSLHEIMEDQVATINKGGISATLMARCSVLALMNPKNNRFDTSGSMASQIDLPASLLSRFDLMFALQDKVNEEKDRGIVDALFDSRDGAQKPLKYKKEDVTKYIIYARSKVKEMTTNADARSRMKEKYIALRKMAGAKDTDIVVTHRQLEGMARLAEAHAKMRLSSVVEIEDADVAVEIVEHYLVTMCVDPGGHMSVDQVMGGKTKHEKQVAKDLAGTLLAIGDENMWVRRTYTVKDIMEVLGVSGRQEEAKIRKTLEQIHKSSSLISYVSDDEFRINKG